MVPSGRRTTFLVISHAMQFSPFNDRFLKHYAKSAQTGDLTPVWQSLCNVLRKAMQCISYPSHCPFVVCQWLCFHYSVKGYSMIWGQLLPLGGSSTVQFITQLAPNSETTWHSNLQVAASCCESINSWPSGKSLKFKALPSREVMSPACVNPKRWTMGLETPQFVCW